MPAALDRLVTLARCRALLREGGVEESTMSDTEVRGVRDTLAALADVALMIQGGAGS